MGWMSVGEFFRAKGADFPVESFKIVLRKLKPEHLPGSRPHKYHPEDLEAAYKAMCEKSPYMRRKLMR